jgi:hypothetical protein
MKKNGRKSTSHKDKAIPSSRKSKQKVDSASPSPKGTTISEPEAFPSSNIPMKPLPSPVLLHQTLQSPPQSSFLPSESKKISTNGGLSFSESKRGPSEAVSPPSWAATSRLETRSPEVVEQKPVLSPTLELPKPAESTPSSLNRLTLHINPEEDDDWFPSYTFTSIAADIHSPQNLNVGTSQPATVEMDGPNTDSRLDQVVTLPPTHNLVNSPNAPHQNVQREEIEEVPTYEEISEKPSQVHLEERSIQTEPSSEMKLPSQALARNSGNARTQQSELIVSPAQDLLRFAKQLRKQSQSSVPRLEEFASEQPSNTSVHESEPSSSKTSVDRQQIPTEDDSTERWPSSHHHEQMSFQESSSQGAPLFSPIPHVPGQYPLSPQFAELPTHSLEHSGPSAEKQVRAETFSLYPQQQEFPSPAREHRQQYQMFPSQRQPSYNQSPPRAEKRAAQPYQQSPHDSSTSFQQLYRVPPALQEYFPPQADMQPLSPVISPLPPAIPLASKPRFNLSRTSTPEIVRMGTPTMYSIPEGLHSGHAHHDSPRSTQSPQELYDRTTSPVYHYPDRASLQRSHTPSSGYGSPYEMWTQVATPPLEVMHHHVHYDYSNAGFAQQSYERTTSHSSGFVTRNRSRGSDIRPPSGRLEDRKLLTLERPVTEYMADNRQMSMTPSRAAPRPQTRTKALERVFPAVEEKKPSRKSSRVFSSLWGNKKTAVATNY